MSFSVVHKRPRVPLFRIEDTEVLYYSLRSHKRPYFAQTTQRIPFPQIRSWSLLLSTKNPSITPMSSIVHRKQWVLLLSMEYIEVLCCLLETLRSSILHEKTLKYYIPHIRPWCHSFLVEGLEAFYFPWNTKETLWSSFGYRVPVGLILSIEDTEFCYCP